MALVGNYSVLNKTPGRFISGASVSHVRSNFSSNASLKNSYLHFGLMASYPSGYYSPYAWSLPRNTGSMSSFTLASGLISPVINLAGGINLEINSISSIVVTNAKLDQIVTLVVTGLILTSVNADLQAAVILQASAVLEFATTANIGAIVSAMAAANCSVTPSCIITALAHMNAEAGGPTPLSPEGLAEAVWGQDISSYVSAGTAGLKLNNASAAGNPWDADTSTNNTAGTFGELVQKLLTVAKFLGLK